MAKMVLLVFLFEPSTLQVVAIESACSGQAWIDYQQNLLPDLPQPPIVVI